MSHLLFHFPWVGCALCLLATALPGCQGPVAPGPVVGRGHQGLLCSECHPGGAGLFRPLPSGSLAMNPGCVPCHPGHETHHPQQVEAKALGCVSCHQEHRGKEELIRVPDGRCTDCHGQLRRQDGLPTACLDVPDWAGHPEFAPQRLGTATGLRRLHFPHREHLRPVRGPGGKSVRLECGACHQLDAAGRYMQPVHYEASCASCHPLSVGLIGVGEGPVAATFRGQPARHVGPEVGIADLRNRLSRLVSERPELLRHDSAREGGWPLRPAPPADDDTRWNWVEGQLRGLKRQLFDHGGGCRSCHVPAMRQGEMPSFEATEVPTRGLTRAFFSHHAHRQIRCMACHDVEASASPRDVKMPAVGVCMTCHRDGTPSRPYEVRASCVGCHSYHPEGQKARERRGSLLGGLAPAGEAP